MTKDEALKMAIEALDTLMMEKGSIYQQALQACKEALEQEDYEKRGIEFENEHLKKELDGAMMMLKEQPAQEPVKWISVKDRLPTEVGRYLVYVKEIYDLGTAYYIWNAGFNPNDGVFQEETMKNGTVTHWMYLPNNPNGISHYINPAPSWKGLSLSEIYNIADKHGMIYHTAWELFARAIEQALKEKNER